MVKASGKQQLPVPVDTAPAFDPTTSQTLRIAKVLMFPTIDDM